ncbi:MAG: endolytic transglycosylase MltG [Bacteroidaceae bacterium]|nr:endolytic transglycosylase MltG [Bacteroidaceae bacterium]
MLLKDKKRILASALLGAVLIGAAVLAGIRLYAYIHRAPRTVRLTIPIVRTTPELAGRLAAHLDADSAELMTAFSDVALIDSLGYDEQTLPAMFIPNTYEVYQWITPRNLMLRLKKESDDFWTSQRRRQAREQGLTPIEVMTLASIVEQETACDAERATIAGLYLNRLRKGMRLQADPTVKYAVGDFSLKRVLKVHLKCDSPYNTYEHEGLPPGPICIPSLASIKAVLKPASHNYIYMCAKEDFSGTHNFAVTAAEHLRNAQNYANALNKAGIR